mgnify:CR=1 FL=1
MKKTSYLAVAAMALFLLFGMWYFLREEPLPVKQPAGEQNSQAAIPGITFSGNSIIEEQDGKKLWDLKADKIEVSADAKTITFFQLTGLYYQSPTETITITSKEAVMDTKTNEFVMKGEVKAVAADGKTFRADIIHYLKKENKFQGRGNVMLTKDDTIVTGNQIDSDSKFEKVIIKGNAQVIKGGKNP